MSDGPKPDFAAKWAFVPPVGGGDNDQNIKNPSTGGMWDVEWTYHSAYRVRSTNP